jgi:hypothetical protein
LENLETATLPVHKESRTSLKIPYSREKKAHVNGPYLAARFQKIRLEKM